MSSAQFSSVTQLCLIETQMTRSSEQVWGIWSCSVQSLSCVWLLVTPWTTTHQTYLSIINSWSLLKLMSIEVGDAIQPSHPLSSPPAFNRAQHQGLFQWVSSSHQWPKYWSFSFSISPFSEYSGLISFRIDWFDLLTVQGSLKHLLQHHSSKASIFKCSAFFIVQIWSNVCPKSTILSLYKWIPLVAQW